MAYKIIVEGQPFGKQRPRVNKFTGTIYTPKETQQYEKFIQACWREQTKNAVITEPYIAQNVKAYYKIPSTIPQAVRDRFPGKKPSELKRMMEKNFILPSAKPDYDNIEKIVSDALCGVAFTVDDCAIVRTQSSKWYSNEPRIEIELFGFGDESE